MEISRFTALVYRLFTPMLLLPWATCLIFLGSGLLSSSAHSSPANADTIRLVSELSRQAADLYREGQFEAASERFLDAYELIPDARIEWNIARCYNSLKRYEEALDWVYRFLAWDHLSDSDRTRAMAFRDRMVAEVERSRAQQMLQEAKQIKAQQEADAAAARERQALADQETEQFPWDPGPLPPAKSGISPIQIGSLVAGLAGLGSMVAGGIILAMNIPIDTKLPDAPMDICGSPGNFHQCSPTPGYIALASGGGVILGSTVAFLLGGRAKQPERQDHSPSTDGGPSLPAPQWLLASPPIQQHHNNTVLAHAQSLSPPSAVEDHPLFVLPLPPRALPSSQFPCTQGARR